jgi:hypothetical protein
MTDLPAAVVDAMLAIWEEFRAGPFEDIPRMHAMAALLRAYAAGRESAFEEAAEFIEAEASYPPACHETGDEFGERVASCLRAAKGMPK